MQSNSSIASSLILSQSLHKESFLPFLSILYSLKVCALFPNLRRCRSGAGVNDPEQHFLLNGKSAPFLRSAFDIPDGFDQEFYINSRLDEFQNLCHRLVRIRRFINAVFDRC